MANLVTRRAARSRISFWQRPAGLHAAAIAVLVLCAGRLGAAPPDDGHDPTRPPAALRAPVDAAATALTPAPAQLQSILVGRAAGARRLAVIDGATVRVGDLVRGARVVAIGATEVRLQRGAQHERLTLAAPVAGAMTAAGGATAPAIAAPLLAGTESK